MSNNKEFNLESEKSAKTCPMEKSVAGLPLKTFVPLVVFNGF